MPGVCAGAKAAHPAFSEAIGRKQMLKALLWIVGIIFVIGLLVVFGVIDLIF